MIEIVDFQTMTQGGISAWNVKEGDAIQPGDVLAQVFMFSCCYSRYQQIRVLLTSLPKKRFGWCELVMSRVSSPRS